jgi:hypothetical protein
MINIVELLCDLAEASDEVFREVEMEIGCDGGLQHLIKLGAVEPGPRPQTVTCNACDADHSAVIEYDAGRRCYVHFCPEAGLVAVTDADLVTHRFRPEWLVDWLATALHVPSSARRRALVPNHVWHLGDAICGDMQITVIFARRISSQAGLNDLVSALRPIHPADNGLIITTSSNVDWEVQLPGGYEFLALREIMSEGPGGLTLDIGRLGTWIGGMPSTTAKGGRTRTGRPSFQDRISQVYYERRRQGLPVDSRLAEAREILKELAKHAAGRTPPNLSTVRRHVSQLTKGNSSP